MFGSSNPWAGKNEDLPKKNRRLFGSWWRRYRSNRDILCNLRMICVVADNLFLKACKHAT